MNLVRVQSQPFDVAAVQQALVADNPSIGAVVSFVGLMRDLNQGERVDSMVLEHYPAMTEKALREIVREADRRWELLGISLLHRVGKLLPGDPIVLVAVASSHRGEAFQACEFIIDFLKTRAPFWKKETTASGERWVEARDSDGQAESRWSDEAC